MSMADGEERHQEIIIVRRGGHDEEEAHHGGVWKIAFADFMTALMCFFLVMWLINAANEQTRAALASYFNPVKLTDRNTSKKGLDKQGEGPKESTADDKKESVSEQTSDSHEASAGPSENENSADQADQKKFSDKNLFSNPYSVLAEIATDTGTKQNVSDKGEGGAQLAGPSSGASGGESYRDPFAPDFWSQQVAVPRDGVEGDPDNAREKAAGADIKAAETGPHELAKIGNEVPNDGRIAAEAGKPSEGASAYRAIPKVEPLQPSPTAAKEKPQPQEAGKASEADKGKLKEERKQLADKIGADLAAALKEGNIGTSVSVAASKEGILISITDDMNYGMFAIGSAVPRRDLVLAMAKIGAELADHPGKIRIEGFTDGRPFADGEYDNWRLSTARAHAAYYMLVRGGLDEQRVKQIAGYADRKLKIPEDPYADANRRIEIVLEVPR